MRLPSRGIVVGGVAAVSLPLVAALHVYIVAISLFRAVYAPSPDRSGLSTTHHVVDLASSLAYLVAVLCCAVLAARFVRSGRPALASTSNWLWAAATLGGVVAAAALCAEIGAVAVDYEWTYADYQQHGDLGALIMDFIGVYALSFPILPPLLCLWFDRLEASAPTPDRSGP